MGGPCCRGRGWPDVGGLTSSNMKKRVNQTDSCCKRASMDGDGQNLPINFISPSLPFFYSCSFTVFLVECMRLNSSVGRSVITPIFL